jgi:hypothetical protein
VACPSVTRAAENGIAIEIEEGVELRERFDYFKARGRAIWLANAEKTIIMHSPSGVRIRQLGASDAVGALSISMKQQPVPSDIHTSRCSVGSRMRALSKANFTVKALASLSESSLIPPRREIA